MYLFYKGEKSQMVKKFLWGNFMQVVSVQHCHFQLMAHMFSGCPPVLHYCLDSWWKNVLDCLHCHCSTTSCTVSD